MSGVVGFAWLEYLVESRATIEWSMYLPHCRTKLRRIGPTVEFSGRERAAATVSKSERSRARSGRLQRLVRRAGRRRSPAPRMRPTAARNHAAQRASVGITLARDHAGTTGVRLEPPTARDHACTTGVRLNHPLHAITRSTTDVQHHGRSYHTGTTRFPHDEPTNHACTTSACTTGGRTTPAPRAPTRREPAQRAFRNRR